jgi:hypothetical protein
MRKRFGWLGGLALAAVLPVCEAIGQFSNILDVNGSLPAGSATKNGGGSFTVVGGGADIWDVSDQFFFAYSEANGDFDVKVRVESLTPYNRWSKAGLMIRESEAPESRMAFNRVTPSGPTVDGQSGGTGADDIRLAYRTGLINVAGANGGQHEDPGAGFRAPGYPNAWLRLRRSGNNIVGYDSIDGVNWTLQNTLDTTTWQGGALPTRLLIGLAVTSHNQGNSATAEFRNLAATTPTVPGIVRQPTNTTVSPGLPANFAVGLAGFDPDWRIQWRANGVAISGATNLAYATAPVAPADNGKNYSVTVSNSVSGVVSANAVLTVADVVNPRVTSVSSRGNPNGITIQWSEVVSSTGTNAANYSVNNGVTVSSARFGANNSMVALTTSGLTEGVSYAVTISNVQDAEGLTMTPNPTVSNFVHGAGYESKPITFKKFNNIGGGTVPDLTNNPAFPNSPSYTALPTLFEDPSPSDDAGTNNNYGCQLSAIYVAPVSGQYTFYMSSDDNGVTYLSSNDQPANKVQICFEPQWNGVRDYAGTARRNAGAPENRSAPIALTAGQKYYLEALMKEGAGGNNVSVAVQEPGQGVPTTPIPASRFAPVRYFGGQIFYTLGSVFVVTQPAGQTIGEGQSATWSVAVDGTPPYFAQWRSNGVAIAGATNLTYVTQPLNATAQGASYSCVVSNEFSSVTSAGATLTVTLDTTRPTLVLAQNIGATNVSVTFSEAVDAGTGTNRFNYALSGGASITRAEFGGDARTILLTTSPLTYGINYTLTVNNVRDRAATPNVILGNSQLTFLTTDFTPQDIGGPAQAGSLTAVAGGYDISAGGTGMGGTSDQFHFDYLQQSGDFDVKVRIESLSLSDTWARAGIMARETLTANSRHAAGLATPSLAGCFYQFRDTTGGNTTTVGSAPVNYPYTWLRLRRVGSQFTAYAGVDGQTWAQLGSATIAMSNIVYLGMATAAGSGTTTAAFREWVSAAGGTVGLVSTGSEPLGPSSRKTPIVISEIMYKPAARSDGRNVEFIELFNSNPFYEEIGNYRISGDIDFKFPAGTIIPGGGFVVIAKAPADIQAVYGVENVTGPYTNSLKANGTVRLRDELDAILLEVQYRDTLPWPVAADGAGHSMVLARPSYGESYAQAWSHSDAVGGSPGGVEAYRPSPVRNVVINEFLAHTDDPVLDFIELYNHSNQAVDISGCFLSDDASTNKFLIPPGTTIPARGFVSFDQAQLGFGLSSEGEKIFFVNSNATRVIDAISFEAQANGISAGRFPDGANDFYPLANRTAGGANGAIRIHDIVINEIMYSPISSNPDDEYVEVYNRGTNPVSLANWRFTEGIDFTFPTNTVLGTNAYLVVARNVINLLAKYPALNAGNTVGNWDGSLGNKGERIALAFPDQVITTNSSGNPRTNTVYIVADEVTYGVGGRWGNWAKEGGSSLELIDPNANHRLAYNWADSDETSKAPWTLIEHTGVLDHGATYNGEPINRLEVMLLGEGECLIDNVEVIGPGSTNRIVNATFEGGITGWTPQGNHVRSSHATTEGYLSSRSLYVRASARGDTGANRIRTPINGALASGNTVTLRMRARWLRGWPEPLMRVKGNYLEATGQMALPANLGTPGERNSRWAANTGPAIYELQHTPAVPAASENVIVTARVHDPDGVSAFTLRYRIDPSATYANVNLLDNGTAEDAIANDGIFSGTIPGQGAGTMVAFYVEASDSLAAVSQLPRGASPTTPECLVRFGDPVPTGSFGTYRQWLTQANVNNWINRPSLSNERIEGTFVYGNFRAIYNMGSRYAGSPYHQGFSSPLANCHYSIEVPQDDLLLGTENFNKVHAPGNGAFDDNTIQREQTGYWMARRIGLAWNYRRYVAMFVNGNRRGTLMEDTQTPGSDVIDELFPDDKDGDLFKLQPWFEFDDVNVTGGSGAGFNNHSWCVLNNFLTTGGVKKQARYRWNFLVRAANVTANNYTNVFNLVNAASTPTTGWTNFVSNMEALVDMEQWLRTFGIEHAVGNWDSFGNRNSQNMYGYKPDFGKWQLLIWDYNIILGNSGSDGPTGDNLFQYQTADTNMLKIYNAPPFRRAYWRALKDIADGPMNNANVDPVMDAKYAAFVANGINVTGPSAAVKGWINSRRSYLLSQLATVDAPFAAGSDFTTNNNLVAISGTAPVGVKTIRVNGIAYTPSWSTIASWTILVPIGAGSNLLTLQGYDSYGNPVAGASDTITVTNTGASAAPQGNVVINEIMYNSALPDAGFVEIHNIHPSVTFDLSNWKLDGADFSFPEGIIIRPGGFLVVANDAWAFATAYGAAIPLAGVFAGSLDNGGETLKLIKPGITPDLDLLIDEVRYDDDLPWPVAADGTGPSLQLIDPVQDNYRAGNWAAVPTNAAPPHYTPGATNSVRATLAPFPLVWINEVQVFNTNGVMDNLSEREPWIELYNNGPTNVSLTGFFLTDTYSNLTRWPFPTGVIQPGRFIVVWADGEPAENAGTNFHTNFRLTNASGGLALVRTNAGRTNVLDYMNYFALSPTRSFGSYPDGQSRTRQLFHFATPRATNDPTLAPVPAVINEWMADNAGPGGFPDPADGLFQDWFELFNPNTNTVDLSGYYLTDTLGQPTKFQIPANTFIAPLGFLLVWADNTPAQNGMNGDLHANFQLSNNGEQLGLFAPDGTPQSTVTFGEQIQNVSQGRWPDGTTNGFYFMTNFTPRAANIVTSSNAAPVLGAIGNRAGNEQVTLSFTVLASDADVPAQTLTFSLDAGAPAGATIHPAAGQFSWVPTEAQGPGMYSVTIRVTDNGAPNLADTETITITVNEVNGVPVLGTIGNRSVNEGSVLAFTATASDSDLPANALMFSLDGGAPLGAAISAGGAFSWGPTEAQGPGSYPVTIRVTDNGTPPLSDSETITVTVNEVNNAPVLAVIADQTIDETATLNLAATATDPDVPAQALTYSIVTGPSNATIHPTSGAFAWTPNEGQGPSTNSITIRASDDGTPSMNHSRTFTVVVNESNTPPGLAAIGNKTASEGAQLAFATAATDGDLPAQTLTFSLDAGAPSGAVITTGGAFTWTPSESQGGTTNSVTIRVTDNGSPPMNDSETITIVVSETNAAPVLGAIGNRTINEGSTLAFTVTATDSDTPAQTMTYSLDAGAPLGASIHPTTGAFTWTPTESQGPGTNVITVRVADSGSPALNDFEAIAVVVNEVNASPVLAAIGNKTVNEGSLLTFTASATDIDAPAQALTFSLDAGAPAGAAINGSSGVFTWTPTGAQGPSTNSVTVRVTDNGSPSLNDFETITIIVEQVNAAPVLAAIGNKTINEGATLTFTATATDPDTLPQTLTYSIDPGAPAGAAINPNTGAFSWTPIESDGPSTNTITVRVTDSGSPSASDSETISVVVNEVNAAPVLIAIGNKNATESALLTFTATASDSDVPGQLLTFSLDAGAPAGAAIGTNGVFTWTPSESQGGAAYAVTIRVSDAGPNATNDFETISITVAEVNSAPGLAAIGDKSVSEGATLAFTASATDSDSPAQGLTFSLDAGAPAGAVIHPTTGAFSWTPGESQGPGTNAITVRVTDNGTPAANDFETITVIVSEVNAAPVLAAIGNKTVNEGDTLAFTASATDADVPAQTLTFSLDAGAPAGAVINPATGAFTWTPTEGQGPSTNTVTVRVTDNGTPAANDFETITITIGEVNLAPTLAAIGNKSVREGSQLTFTASAADADLPANTLTFTLDPGAPSGASIHPATGVFTWTPSLGSAPVTNSITVRISDNGSPPLAAFETILVQVTAQEPPVVALSSPINNGLFAVATPITLQAAASDPDGTIANVAFFANGTLLGADTGAPFTFLWSNAPAGTHTLHATATDDAGLSNVSAVVTIDVRPAVLTNISLIATGSVWRYHDRGIDLGSSWIPSGYDDSGWSNGLAQLGYGDSDEATVISYGTNINNKIITYYFRRAFNVGDAETVSALMLNILRDDGAVAYLNGVEVFRTGMPAGPITFATRANITVGGIDETRYYSNGVAPSLLVSGLNTLAVEVHQVTSNSTDASFDCSLIATQTAFAPWIIAQPAEQQIPSGSNAAFAVSARGTAPLAYQWRYNGAPVPGANASTLIVSNATSAQAGDFSVVVSNPAGAVTSVVARLVITAPVLDPVGNRSVAEGNLLSFTVTASDPDLPAQTLIFSLDTGAPDGATINPNSGVFSWTPGEAQGPGVYSITVRVSDNGSPPQSDAETITVSVNEVNVAPVLGGIGNQSVTEGATLSFSASATDADFPSQSLTFTLDAGAPAGASITGGGLFTWAPTEAQGPATNTITIRVADNGSPSLTDSETITVIVNESNAAPLLAGIGNRSVNEGATLTFTATATDSDVPAQALAFRLGPGAPAGASITTGGVFTWTPGEAQAPGTNLVTIRVTDSGSPSADDAETITIAVNEVNSAPTLGAIGNRTINEGATLSFTAVATDADAPSQSLTFSLDAGAPAGASITGDGMFTWTPTEGQGPNTNTITIRVTDGGSPPLSDFETITVVVNEVNVPPVLAGIGDKSVDEGVQLAFSVNASDADAPAQSLTFSLDPGAPAGVNITSQGVFTWTPSETQGPNTNQVTIRVTDSGVPAQTDFETITIIVREVNTAPILANIPDRTFDEGAIITFTATASDVDQPGQLLTYSLDAGAPMEASIDPMTGNFLWNTAEIDGPGTNLITIRVTDNASPPAMDSQVVRIIVRELNQPPVPGALADRTIFEGQTLSFTASASDGDLPAQQLTFGLQGAIPAGASITTAGAFTWTPSEAQGPTTNVITVRVSDDGMPPAQATASCTVIVLETNSAPVLAAIANTNIIEGITLSFTANATDADLPGQLLTFSLEPGGPTNATLSAAGEFTWTPDESFGGTTNSFTIRVTDSGSPTRSAIQSFSVIVVESNSAPVLASIGSRSATEDGFLSFIVSATDIDVLAQQLTFSLDAGAPAGAGIDPATGEFTWTPNEDQAPGSHSVTIRVTDNGVPARSAVETILIDVTEVNTTPVLASIGNQSVDENGLLSFTATASDADRPAQTLTFTLDAGAPAGANITSAGLFTWSTTEVHGPGTYTATVRVTDSFATSDTLTVAIIVNEVNNPPALANIPDQSINAGSELVWNVSASDSDLPAQALTFGLDGAPPSGASIESATGVFRWTPPANHTPATNVLSVRVTDSWTPALSDLKTFRIIVITAPRILTVTRSGSTATLTWQAAAGQSYQVQYCDDLGTGNWADLGAPVIASGSTAMAVDSSVSSPQRFYRIIRN